ncbi:MAG TPA: leucyl aminopeptidase family protein [Patescibacteria group bacterium]|nr:leucyl aminopeptidase family protein [Patescibacteria group bacterium]
MKTASVSFQEHIGTPSPRVIIPVFEDQPDNVKTQGARQSTKFNGKTGQLQPISHPFDQTQVYLLGLGKQADFGPLVAAKVGESIFKSLPNDAPQNLQIDGRYLPQGIVDSVSAQIADAVITASYAFTKYKTMPNPASDKAKIDTLNVQVVNAAAAENAYAPLAAVTRGQFLAADVTNEPSNILHPKSYSEIIKDELESLGVKVWVLEKDDLEALQMAGVLAVSAGANIPARVVLMEYDGTNGQQPEALGLAGKGVTFDTGGISIKPSANMGDMKMDMGGSGVMVGSIYAAASTKMPIRILGIVGLTKNMPDGASTTPGDVIKTGSGKTVTDDNTDAEGRLVLMELLTLLQHQEKLAVVPKMADFKPVKLSAIVDAATLTGAQVVALGNKRAAVFSNDESLPGFSLDQGLTLAEKFNRAGRAVNELAWPMPLGEDYAAVMRRSSIADLTNLGSGAGSSTAAEFLHFFIEKDENGKDKVPWVHIDMAGPGIPDDKISKGWGVRLMVEMFKRHFQLGAPDPSNRPTPPPFNGPMC